MRVLGIESSCDETSVAIVRDDRKILSNVISTQIDTHKLYGGVVPEIASRKHVEGISLVIDQAFAGAGLSPQGVDLVGVIRGPSLIGALLVDLSAAKTFALVNGKEIVGINHMHGYVCVNYLAHPDLEPPSTSLVIPGGHTYLLEAKDYLDFEILGQTRDDAAGEASDKVARALGIDYPGGPIVDQLAEKGKSRDIFPRVMPEKGSYGFSFSGLKTAVMNYPNQTKQRGKEIIVEDTCTSFQDAVLDVLVEKSLRFLKDKRMKTLVLSGGVAASSALRSRFQEAFQGTNYELYYPPKILCTDSGAIIANATYYTYQNHRGQSLYADPSLGILSTETLVQ